MRNRKRVTFREAEKIINFRLISGTQVARARRWGHNIFLSEARIESNIHKRLKEISVKYFRGLGYRINQSPAGPSKEYVLSDYFMVKDGKFYFVECLTKATVEKNPKVIKRKLILAKYAPLWFVLEDTINLDLFPKERNISFLLINTETSQIRMPIFLLPLIS